MLQKIYPLVALVLLMCLGISYSTEYRTTEYKTTSYRTTEYIMTKYVVSMTGQDFRDYCFSLSDTNKVDFSAQPWIDLLQQHLLEHQKNLPY